MIDQKDISALSGATVRASDGDKIGRVAQVYLNDTDAQPAWVTVRTGLFGGRESFVPLAAARFEDDELVVNASKDTVTGAPQVDADGHISEEEEAEIYRYYGVSDAGSAYGTDRSAAETGRHTPRYADSDRSSDAQAGTVGRDTSGPITDDAMTRSEEHLRAGTEQVETGRARLRKYVVTETQQVDVPVSREEVRLEREPITESNRDAADDGPAISEEEHEVTLRAERPVVATEAVPVERVRLDKETVTETERVSGEIRKEQVELDDPTGTARPR